MNVNDTIVEYDPNNPPAYPNWGVLAKWVRTPRVSWNTDSYKCYFYKGMPFRLKFPLNYDTTGNTQYPMIVMFHGRGNYDPSLYDNEIPLHTGGDGGKRYRDAVDNGEFDGFVLFPQNTTGFFNSTHFAALNELINNFLPAIHVDINRISLTGSSAGAYSVWNAVIEFPTNYAAVLPMSGVSTNNISSLPDMKQVPVWLFQGGNDQSPAPYTAHLVKDEAEALGMDFSYTEYPNAGHGIWPNVYKEPNLIPYMIKANKTNPIVYFGKSEFCPGDTITATLGLTPGFDEYEWRKDGVLIPNSNSNELVVTELGTYDARIRRGTDWSYWSVIPVEIKMKDSTITPPIQVIGMATHVLPAPDSINEVTLTVGGGFEEYAWKLAGQSTVLSSDETFTTSVPGNYVVTVTEKFGCESSDSPEFSVVNANAANGPGAPGDVNVFTISKTSLKLVWNDNPNSTYNETAFEIYRSETPGGPYQFIGTAPRDATEYMDEDLLSNITYYYVIRAINGNAASATTAEKSGTTKSDQQLPSPVTLSLVKTTPNSISVIWNAATDDVGVEKYEVYVGGVKSVVTADTSATIYNLAPYLTYNITVRARDYAGNYAPMSTPLTVITVKTGLDYTYYEGAWSNLPDFRNLTPVDSGHVDNIDITLKQVTDDYAFLWEGVIHIPVAGNYTFETRSDDGSKVYIGGYDTGTVVVDNDGTHSARYRSGTYNFPSAGVYPIAVSFFRNGGSETMELYWKNTPTGIGSTRQLIPNSAFVDYTPLPGNPPQSPQGLEAVAVNYNRINLTWADSSNNETGFQIFRKSAPNGEFLPITTTAANVTSYSDTNLTAATTYDYKIVAIGNYGLSNIDPEGSVFSLNFNNNIDDQSGNLTNSLQNGATYANGGVEGGYSLLLDGVDDYVVLGPGNGLFVDPFTEKTVAMWVKIEDHTGTRMIFEEGGTSQGLGIRTNAGQLEAAVRQSSNQFTIGAAFTDTNWAHIAVVFDNGRFSLYINGVLAAENPNIGYTEITSHTNAAGLGATNGNSNCFGSNGSATKGRIDDMFVYLDALTEAEINGLIIKNSIYDQATTFPLPSVPTAPGNAVATALSTSGIQLSWDDNSNNEDQFTIYRSVNTNNNFIPLTVVAGDTAVNGKSYTDTGLYANLTYHYLVVAENAGGADSSEEASTTTLNNVPVLDATQNVLMRYNSTLDIQLYASDIDNDTITLSGINLPSFATLTDYEDGSGLLSLAPAIGDTNVYNGIVIVAMDNNGGTVSDTFNISVTDNYIPVLAPVANVIMNEGDSVSIEITATDSNGVGNLHFSATGLPACASLSGNMNGTALLTIVPGFADGGQFNGIEITVDDQEGGIAQQQFDIIINEVNPNRIVKVNFRHSVAAASPWNNVINVNPTALNDDQGNPTGYGVDVLGTVWNSYNDGRITGNNSGIVPDDVLKEYYYFGIFGAPNVVNFNITGLDTAGAYNLSFVSSSQWNGVPNNGTTKFTVDGQVDSVYAHFNTTNSANFTQVSPDNSGNLLVSMSKAAGTSVGYLNGFILEEVYNYGNAPDAPRNLIASFGGNSVHLNWYDAPYNEEGYNVFRSDSAAGTYVQVNTQPLAANATSYTDNNVSENLSYYYKVAAVNAFGTSAYSNIVNVHVPNTAPAVAISGNTMPDVDSTAVLLIEATDSPLNTITLSTINLPSFASFTDSGNGNGSISFTPSLNDVGNHSFTVKATDNLGASRTEVVTITVKDQKLYSVYVNFSKNFNQGAPWNNTAKAPALNDVFNNVNDDSNNPSGINLQLISSFGGDYNEGAQTGDNSGIVPDNVLREYYWFGIFGAPNQAQLKVSGLDNQKKYNFRFVGSSTFSGSGVTDNGETNYTIGNQTASVDVQANTSNAALIAGVIADNNGEVIVTITKGNGASVGYINAMIIDVYNADTTRFDPQNLTAAATSSSTINLNWQDNALDESGFEIQRSVTGLEMDFTAIDTTAGNVVSYVDSGLNNTTVYYYRVRAIRGSSNTGFTNIASSGTIAFSVYININGNAAYNAPAPWNNLGISPSDNDVFTGFKNSQGNPTGMEMLWNHTMAGSNEWGVNTGNNSGIYPDLVTQSFFFSDAFDAPAIVTMRGLSQAFTYNFKFFGSIVTGYDIHTNFTIGNKTVNNAQTNNTSEVVTISNVVPDNNNEAGIKIQEAAGSNWAIFNAMVVEAVTAATINSKGKPEIEKTPGAIEVAYGLANPEINLFPNPMTGDLLNIGFVNGIEGDLEVSITDMTGRVVKQRLFYNEFSKGTIVMNIGDTQLQNGIYIVNVKFGNGKVTTARFVRMNSDY